MAPEITVSQVVASMPESQKDAILSDVTGRAQRASDAMAAKQEEYDIAKQQESVFNETRRRAEKEYEKLKVDYDDQGTNEGEYESARSKFNSAVKAYSTASNDTDALRSSLLYSIFYKQDMYNTAAIVEAQLGLA